MYDSDRDGLLTHAEFNELMQDISSHVMQQQVEDSVRELALFELTGQDVAVEMISYDDFQMVMEEHHILPSFATPHQKSDDSQIEAYRDLHAPERCDDDKTPLCDQALGFKSTGAKFGVSKRQSARAIKRTLLARSTTKGRDASLHSVLSEVSRGFPGRG